MYRIYIVSFFKKPIAHFMIILCMVVFQSCAQFRPINVDINNYSYEINRDFWGVPHIKGATNKDIAFGIGYVHAEDAYEDLVQLMPLYKGENGIKNGIDGAPTDYLIRLLKIHEKYDENEMNDYMKNSKIDITVSLGKGSKKFTAYTMDLTHNYVKINSDYRS